MTEGHKETIVQADRGTDRKRHRETEQFREIIRETQTHTHAHKGWRMIPERREEDISDQRQERRDEEG